MMVPVLPAALWLLAAAFLILLLLVIFGYHLYQRTRLAALAKEAGGLGQLAARKERLEADTRELGKLLGAQKEELQKLDGERRAQEVLRADLTQLDRVMTARKKENESSLKQAADLDVMLVKKRNQLSRLEAEVQDMEARKAELEPLDKSVQNLRIELETGKIRAALLAEQELKTANLQQLGYALGREVEEMQRSLEPMRQEKNRLHLFIEQARHASSVKNERILEQNEEIRNLEIGKEELKRQIDSLSAQLKFLQTQVDTARKDAVEQENANQAAKEELEDRNRQLREEVTSLTQQARQERTKLEALAQRKEEADAEIARLQARKALIELELERIGRQGAGQTSRSSRRPLPHIAPVNVHARKRGLHTRKLTPKGQREEWHGLILP